VIAGQAFPDIYGGWTNTFEYKGIDLNVFFQYAQGFDVYRSEARFTEANLNSVFNNRDSQLNYWTASNPNAPVPEPRLLTQNGRQHSTRFLEDGSYIRLKTISLGYTLPSSMTGDYSVRIFAQGQNLATFTGYEGYDPETTDDPGNIGTGDVFFAIPQSRTITFGVNLGF